MIRPGSWATPRSRPAASVWWLIFAALLTTTCRVADVVACIYLTLGERLLHGSGPLVAAPVRNFRSLSSASGVSGSAS